MVSGRQCGWVLSLVVVVCGAGCAADPSSEVDRSAPTTDEAELNGKAYDIPLSEKLIAEAEAIAATRQRGESVCEDGTYLSDISDRVRRAIAVRDTVFFRTRIVARKAGIARELAGTLDWQEFMGAYDPKKVETLPAALSNGVNFWDTNGGAYGNQVRLEFRANGQLLRHQLDTESSDFRWNVTQSTWSIEGDRISVGDESYRIVIEQGSAAFTDDNGAYVFVDGRSECDA